MNEPASPEELTEKILKARAKRLARLTLSREPLRNRITVIEFSIAHEAYAIELTHIRTVHSLRRLTYIPGAPGFIKGIFNLRGEIISVVDLAYFFDLPERTPAEAGIVVILASESMEFGILVDAIHGVMEIDPDDIQTSLPTLSGIRMEYIKGVTATGVAVLNDEKLLTDKQMVVSL